MLTIDSTDTAPDFINNPDEDLADVIGNKSGLAMEFESDEEVDSDVDYKKWFLQKNGKTFSKKQVS